MADVKHRVGPAHPPEDAQHSSPIGVHFLASIRRYCNNNRHHHHHPSSSQPARGGGGDCDDDGGYKDVVVVPRNLGWMLGNLLSGGGGGTSTHRVDVGFDETGEIIGVAPPPSGGGCCGHYSAAAARAAPTPAFADGGGGGEVIGARPSSDGSSGGRRGRTTDAAARAAARGILADIDANIGRAEEERAMLRRRSGRKATIAAANDDDDDDDDDDTADRDDRADDASMADHSNGWLQFVNTVGRMCKSKSSECSTRSTDSMTTAEDDDDTMIGGGDDDSIFESVAKSSGGGGSMGLSSSSETTTTTSSPSQVSSREVEFWQAVSKMRGVRETQPLGGPKYYVVSITDMGIARILHEAMPPMTSGGAVQVAAAAVAEERGFEVIEYDLLEEKETREEEGGCFITCGMGEFMSPQLSNDDVTGAGCVSPTVAELVGMEEEVVEPKATTDLEKMDVQWMEGQEDVVRVISDCTRVSVESGITMDSSLTDGTTEEDNIMDWNDGENTQEHSIFACCHTVVFD